MTETVLSKRAYEDGLHSGRLDAEAYAQRFADAHPPLTRAQALVEAERCYYCDDAPCIAACPTAINIPSFVHRIAQDNLRGAARAILEANPLGGMCARVCPTENLCEGACVRLDKDDKPVEIGQLQRYATDAYFSSLQTGQSRGAAKPLFTRAASTGKRVAVVGSGPAGLACAHGLARRGHEVTLFEAKSKCGGLNEYGLATYKTAGGFAQQEVQWLLSVGNITVHSATMLGREVSLDKLVSDYDAVFLGVGLAGVNGLGLDEPDLKGLRDAVEFIAELRQNPPQHVAVGRRVVVIGGGMTAVDAAVQASMLGAEEVTIVYRRGPEAMSASRVEQDWAQTHNVRIVHWAAPLAVVGRDGAVQSVQFARTEMHEGRLVLTEQTFDIAADMVLKAIGQRLLPEPWGQNIQQKDGRILTDEDGKTSLAKVWAGGDCRYGGQDLTVAAVEHGKRSANAIDAFLRA